MFPLELSEYSAEVSIRYRLCTFYTYNLSKIHPGIFEFYSFKFMKKRVWALLETDF